MSRLGLEDLYVIGRKANYHELLDRQWPEHCFPAEMRIARQTASFGKG